MRVAVVAHVGTTNLGDEAILSSALQALRTRLAEPSIRVYSPNPPETTQRHGVEAVALRSQVIGTARKAQATGRDPAAPAAGAAHKRTLTQSLRATVRRIPLLAPLLRAAIRCMQGVVAVGRESVFIVRSWRRLRGTDMLLIAGSNQLEDWFGGPWGYPYTILLWTVLARAVGARVAFVCVGAGPLNSRLSRWLCVRALALASYASFRDAESLE